MWKKRVSRVENRLIKVISLKIAEKKDWEQLNRTSVICKILWSHNIHEVEHYKERREKIKQKKILNK